MSPEYAKRIVQRLAVGLLAVLLALIIGSMVGYAIGGGNPLAVLIPTTWTHIFDFLR